MSQRNRVGVRELRQNLSVYLRRVKAGESLDITERGEPVARLEPLAGRRDARSRLIAAGRLIPGDGSLGQVPPPLPARGRPLRRELDAVREDVV
jgi:prevent-host-death family protein